MSSSTCRHRRHRTITLGWRRARASASSLTATLGTSPPWTSEAVPAWVLGGAAREGAALAGQGRAGQPLWLQCPLFLPHPFLQYFLLIPPAPPARQGPVASPAPAPQGGCQGGVPNRGTPPQGPDQGELPRAEPLPLRSPFQSFKQSCV